jgi:hypothetical protein
MTMTSWTLDAHDQYNTRRARYEKKHRREAEAVHANLGTYLTALGAGNHPMQIKYGFVHNEPLGVKALDQSGGHGRNLAETRLYVYPDVDEKVLHLITLGDKGSQGADVQYCREFVLALRKGKQDGAQGPQDGTIGRPGTPEQKQEETL